MASSLPSCLVCEKDGVVTVTLVRDQDQPTSLGEDNNFSSMTTMEMMCYRYGSYGYGMWRNRNNLKVKKWERCLERMRKMCEEFTDEDVKVILCSKCWGVFKNQDSLQDEMTSFALGVGRRILTLAGEELPRMVEVRNRKTVPPPPHIHHPHNNNMGNSNSLVPGLAWSRTGGINMRTRRGPGPVPKSSFTDLDKDTVVPAPASMIPRDEDTPIASASPIVKPEVVMERPVPKPRLSLIKKALEQNQFSTENRGFDLLPVNFFQNRVRNHPKPHILTFPDVKLDDSGDSLDMD